MRTKTIIIYSSVDGQTQKICHYLKEVLISNNHSADLFNINYAIDTIFDFDKIIIASSIRNGKHNEQKEKFIQKKF